MGGFYFKLFMQLVDDLFIFLLYKDNKYCYYLYMGVFCLVYVSMMFLKDKKLEMGVD